MVQGGAARAQRAWHDAAKNGKVAELEALVRSSVGVHHGTEMAAGNELHHA